jgi:hypothetical protein
MRDKILADIIEYATNKLNQEYGFCGVAQGPTMAMLNSSDKDGKDISINFNIQSED